MALPVRAVKHPRVLHGKSNGRLPRSILVTVAGQAGGADVTLVEPAARAWAAMAAAAAEAGHVLKIGWVNSAYRPYSDQERIFRARYYPSMFGTRSWQGKRWRKHKGVAAAAVPGTSNHGWALAVDVGEESDGDAGTESLDAGTLSWLKIHAHRFGWSWEIQSEPWHLRYWAGDVIPKSVLEYEAMQDLTAQGGHAMLIQYGFFAYLNEGWRYRFLSSPNSVASFKSAGIPVVDLGGANAATWKALRREALADGRLVGEPADVAATYE